MREHRLSDEEKAFIRKTIHLVGVINAKVPASHSARFGYLCAHGALSVFLPMPQPSAAENETLVERVADTALSKFVPMIERLISGRKIDGYPPLEMVGLVPVLAGHTSRVDSSFVQRKH